MPGSTRETSTFYEFSFHLQYVELFGGEILADILKSISIQIHCFLIVKEGIFCVASWIDLFGESHNINEMEYSNLYDTYIDMLTI